MRYDAKTLQTFETEFYKIDEYLERGVVGYQLWLHVIDGKMSSLQYFQFVVNNLAQESVEQNITTTLGNLEELCSYYLPLDKVAQCQKQLFEKLLLIMSKDDLHESQRQRRGCRPHF